MQSPTSTSPTSTRSASPTIRTAAIAFTLLLSALPPVDARGPSVDGPLTTHKQGKPYPDGGVLFGAPPDDVSSLAHAGPSVELRSTIIAEFEIAGGFVRFVDEGESVSTIIKGGRGTFEAVAGARTVGQLFDIVAPAGASVPAEIAPFRHEPLYDLIAGRGTASGATTFEEEFEFGADDWAEGCAGDGVSLWQDAFENWHGFQLGDDDFFSTTNHWDFGGGIVNDAHGYFGTLDEVWFGVCMVDGVLSAVEMERRYYDFCDGAGCGNWGPIGGTYALIAPGERYLYHNHSIYSPLRRGVVNSIGDANVTGWEYFISGAGSDTFDPDDQFQAAKSEACSALACAGRISEVGTVCDKGSDGILYCDTIVITEPSE